VNEITFECWPADFRRITQRFGVNPQNYRRFGLPGHEGIDFGVPLREPFYAVASGAVVYASDRRWTNSGASAYGWHVVLDHGDWCSIYAHAMPDLLVQVGEEVAAGQVVGLSGNTGNSSGPHLHFGVMDKSGKRDARNGYPRWRFGRPINPEKFLP